MKKYLIIILFLTISIYFSYTYLMETIDSKLALKVTLNNDPLIYQKRELILDDIESFNFDDYFTVLSNSNYRISYIFNENSIDISLNDKHYIYPYTIREKEKEIVTEYVIQEVYIETPVSVDTNNSYEHDVIQYEEEKDYLNIINSTLSISSGTDLNDIIYSIQNNIDTNVRISVDYSSLNPNYPGDYIIYIYSDIGNNQILIKII